MAKRLCETTKKTAFEVHTIEDSVNKNQGQMGNHEHARGYVHHEVGKG